jgi:uncharacterized membrane protein
MNPLIKNRIESIDLLKGVIMVIMALDHVRDYVHAVAHIYSPTNPQLTSWPIFFTRWITDFCAPGFSFLAGLSAFLVGRKKSIGGLSVFLLKRGLWLVLIEVTIVNFGWYFDIHFTTINLIVIWALGVSMIVLAALIHLPKTVILIFSCLLIFGHNLLDGVHYENIFWQIIHQGGIYQLPGNRLLFIGYPLIPWIATMSLGYCFGSLYDKSFDAARRKKILNTAGFSAIILFIILIVINKYGNPFSWQHYDTVSKTLMSILNPLKYPPSLLYLLMTLGPILIFLANTENLKGRVVNFFSTFGRVPFFYYVLHIYLVHFIALLLAQFSGIGWQKMILPFFVTEVPALKGYGFHLWVVYAVWAAVIIVLYPLCKMFDNYKMNHKEKWWLSYL